MKWIITIIISITTHLAYSAEYADNKKNGSYVIETPLQNEFREVYYGSKEVGKKTGKGTKYYLCHTLHIKFFCKGESYE